MSSVPTLRLNRLVSSLPNKEKQCIKTLLDNGLKQNAASTLRSFLKDITIGEQEMSILLNVLSQPQIPKKSDDTSHSKLVAKTEQILIKHQKLKNNSKFVIRDKMGKLSTLEYQIGKDINEILEHTELSVDEINRLTRQWAQLLLKLDEIDEDIKKEDDGLIAFDLKTFVTQIDRSYLNKKQLLKVQQNKNKKKKRIVMQDKTNINTTNDRNKNKKNNQKPKQISNPKSHLMRQQYSQFVDLEQCLDELNVLLNQKRKELITIATNFGVVTDDGKCNQEQRWTNTFDSDVTVGFVGQNGFKRYKSGLKQIKTLKCEIKNRKEKLATLMNQATWKKIGKTRGNKSMRERVSDYNNEKQRRNEKNAMKREKNGKKNAKTNDKQKVNKTDKKNRKDGNIFDFFVPQNIGFKRKSNPANIKINLEKKSDKRKRMNNNDTNNNNKNNNEKSEMECDNDNCIL